MHTTPAAAAIVGQECTTLCAAGIGWLRRPPGGFFV